MNRPTLASTRTNAPVTAMRGTNGSWPAEPVTARCTTMAYTKVDTNTPSANWMARSRRKARSTRGENCPLVSCSTTMVMENTRPVNAIMAWVIDDRKLRAPSGGPGNRTPVDTGRSAWSRATSPTAAPMATATHAAGTSQNIDRNSSRTRSRETIDPGPPVAGSRSSRERPARSELRGRQPGDGQGRQERCAGAVHSRGPG